MHFFCILIYLFTCSAFHILFSDTVSNEALEICNNIFFSNHTENSILIVFVLISVMTPIVLVLHHKEIKLVGLFNAVHMNLLILNNHD